MLRVIGRCTLFKQYGALKQIGLFHHYSTHTLFTATRVKDALKEGRDFLSSIPKTKSDVVHATDTFSTRVVLSHVLGFGSRLVGDGDDNMPINKDQATTYKDGKLLERVAKGEPLQYVIGEWSFSDIELFISPDVLIPRSDSEVVIAAIESNFPDKNKQLTVVDIGVGSGCLLLATLNKYPNARGIGIDISPTALAVTKKNSERLGMVDRTSLFCIPMQDLLVNLQNNHEEGQTIPHDIIEEILKADILISNPPYIKTEDIATLQSEVRDHEPFIALDGGEDGLQFYRILSKIFNIILGYNKQSHAFFEIGFGQKEDITNILESEKHTMVKEVCKDYSGIDRCTVAQHKPVF